MSFARRTLLAALTFTAVAAFAAVRFPAFAQTKTSLVIGATAGPYADQVRLGIKPLLEARGYRVKVVEFNDYIQPNFALAQGDLDANVFQHIVYLSKFSTENKLALSELIKVPTAPIAVYSRRHRSLAEVRDGATVALPNDPTNAARALVVLEQIGWLKLREGYDPIRVSERDVALNVKKLKLIPLEAAQLPRSLDDTDFSFVNGNFALASGLKLSEALAVEKTSPTYQNLVAVRSADKYTPWARDIAEAYRSRAFLAVTETRFAGFVKTDYQQALSPVVAK